MNVDVDLAPALIRFDAVASRWIASLSAHQSHRGQDESKRQLIVNLKNILCSTLCSTKMNG